MSEYKSAEDYIDSIQKKIRWKRAKVPATREIADHITDQCDAYVDGGCSAEEALSRTLAEMGDPAEIGEELNLLHRPRTNWSLILLTAAFILIGTLSDIVLLDAGYLRNLLAVAVGCIIATVLYFTDYTIAIRFPRTCYFSLLAITALAIAYDARIGLELIGYSYSFYLLLLFPIIQTVVAYQIKISRSNNGLSKLAVYLFLPLLGAALISSVPAIICLSISDIILLAYVAAKKWYPVKRITIVCIVSVCAIGMLFLSTQTNLWNRFFSSNGDFISELTREKISQTGFLKSSLPDVFVNNPEYAIARLTMRYGWSVMVIAVFLFSLFVFLFIKAIRKQIDLFGQLISCQVLILLFSQFLLSMLGNLGLISGLYVIPFPFIAGGGMFTIYNLCLIGTMLSVCRHQDIAKDWMSIMVQKAEKKEELHCEQGN